MSLWRKSDEIVGFLDHGTEITGELQFSNTLRIDGNFHGSIVGEDRLIIGEQAVVHADIKVGDIEIRGQVFGNVEVKAPGGDFFDWPSARRSSSLRSRYSGWSSFGRS